MIPDPRIRQAADLTRHAEYAVALTGAGISTPSGIPDFRSPDTGLWVRFDPMEVASIWAFRQNPEKFYEMMRPLAKTMLEAEPNPAHYALAELEEMGLLHAIITQNVDDLHQRAGSKRVLEVHGNMRQATCLGCHRTVPGQTLIEQLIEEGKVPRCAQCGGVLKPNVIFFGELLPVDVLMEAEQEARKCDLMLVAGSYLEVIPAADLPRQALRHGAKLIIVNYQPTGLDHRAEVVIHEDLAQILPCITELCRT
ncbi:MAG: NAD-dependent protein deacylase [Anaerolineae bacterium]